MAHDSHGGTARAARIKLTPGIDIETAVGHINELERRLKAQVPGLKWCFVELDPTD